MPVPYKVTFNDDGNKCPRNIIELREKPECGVLFREEQPFKPDNRFPLPKGFELKHIGNVIPGKINIPQGIMPSSDMPAREDPRRLAFTEGVLPQDENQVNMSRRINAYRTEYERISGITETELTNVRENIPEISKTFTHQDVDRVIQSLDETMPIMVRDMLVDALEEPVLEQPRSIIKQSRIRPLGDPRNTEFTEKLRPRGMTVAELIEDHIQQLKRTMPPDTHKEINKVVEQELFPTTAISEEMEILKSINKYVRKGRNEISQRELDTIIKDLTGRSIKTERIMEVVDKYNAFDPAFEKAIGGVADSQERAFLRRMKAVRTMIQEEPTLLSAESKNVSYGTFEDSNLIPKDVQISTDTPLTESDTTRSRRFTLSQEASYYARRAKNLLPSQDYTDPQFDTFEETTFERVKATNEASSELGKRLQLEALGVREKMVKAGKRLFAQEYAPVSLEEPVSFEMSDAGAIKLRIPETNTNIQGLRDIGGVDPFSDTISSRKLTKLSFAERISAPKVTDIATGGAGAVGGLFIGFGVSQLLDQAKVNKYLNAAVSGASADVGGRIITYGAERAALSAGFRTAEVAALTGSALARGIAEGGIIGLATMPIDMMLNSTLRNSGLSHTASNMISSGVVGTGTIAAIWGTGAAGAPESLGASMAVAALSVGALELIAFLTGQSADIQIDKHNSINNTRGEFLKTLADYDYNYIEALNNFKDIDGLGRKEKDWSSWSNNLNNVFSKYPKENETGSSSGKLTIIPKDVRNEIARLEATGRRVDARRAKELRNQITETPDESGLSVDDKLSMQKYFQKYMIHNIVKKVCSGKECSSELLSQDTGELTDEEVAFLNSKTDRAWQSQADMQVDYSIVEMNYTQKRVQDAKQTLINNWENNRTLPDQLDNKNILKIANLDPNFKGAFDNAVKLDAQREVVNAFMTSQTKMENLPENIQKAANYDKEFYYMIHVYYQDIEHTAGKMNLSVPQLIQLQGLPEDKQNETYRKFQFNYAKMDDKTVGEAISISKEEDTVREAGYYDIDQAYLNTDPTAVGIWKPTDSQILQAHSAGMTLQMYVNYMHELSKGKTGDFSKLPDYDPEDIKASGILDFSHFQDELQIGGFDKQMYSYNPETLSITLNPNVNGNNIPSTQNHFVSRYTPENVLRSRQETADLLHGLDQQNQGIIDTYNTELRKQLSTFGENYNKQVASINDNRSYNGINNLLVFDENTAYETQHLEFQPATIVNNVPVHSGDKTIQRQLADQPETGTIPSVIKDPEKVGGDYVGTSVPTVTDNRPQRDTSYKPGDEITLDD